MEAHEYLGLVFPVGEYILQVVWSVVGDDHGINRDVLTIRPKFIEGEGVWWPEHAFFE